MDIYHEKQSLLRCGIHAINNLLQRKEYTTHDFEEFSKELEGSNSYYFGIGNYDVNILIHAIEKLNLQWKWFDKRHSTENIVFDDNIVGLLINIVQKRFYLFNTRHWMAIKKIDSDIYLLDSKASDPIKFSGLDECQQYLEKIISKNNAEIIIVKNPNNNE